MKKFIKISVCIIGLIAFNILLNSCTTSDLAQEDELYDTQSHDWIDAGRGT